MNLRTKYPGWYKYGSPFHVWSNDYQRTVDSARLFARGYGGPNATAYLVTDNYRAVLDYNCSNFYALSVTLLADRIIGH